MREAVEQLLTRYEVSGVQNLSDSTHPTQRPLRRYGSRPAGRKVDFGVSVKGEINEAAVTQAIGKLGWRVDATNQPQETLSQGLAVLAYRSEYLIERGRGRLKNKPLSLTPMSLGVGGTRQGVDSLADHPAEGTDIVGVCGQTEVEPTRRQNGWD